ncbi:MAG: aminoglycoside phosphotransferase family protein [Actinobacteria bacterium]|nr:aminoglycoside phosphotransferase family protein [Actinomycetota bacterium]
MRRAVETRIEDHVAEDQTQPGGFSPGAATRLRTTGGKRIFLKAISVQSNPETPDMHRREAHIVAAMPPDAPVPKLLWTFEESGWVCLGFEDVDGRHPELPWKRTELDRVMASLDELARTLTPPPIIPELASEFVAREFTGWGDFARGSDMALDDWSKRNLERLVRAEARAPSAVEGNTLLHLDLRADNMLIDNREDRVWIVDWPWARVGASWFDIVGMAPSVAMQGGPKPEDLVNRFALMKEADADQVTAVVVGLAGFFMYRAAQPPPPGIPTVRAFQKAQGEVACRWIQERTGWR